MFDEPDADRHGVVGPTDLREMLEMYDFSEDDSFTDPDALPEEGSFSFYKFYQGDGYAVDYHVPINGLWSDLTLQVRLLRRPKGFAVVFQDLHIL